MGILVDDEKVAEVAKKKDICTSTEIQQQQTSSDNDMGNRNKILVV